MLDLSFAIMLCYCDVEKQASKLYRLISVFLDVSVCVPQVPFPNVSATALVEYVGVGAASELHHNNNDDSTVTNNNMMLPMFPAHNDSAYRQAFDAKQFSFNTSDQTFYIPQTVDIHLLFTVSYGLASNTSCYPLAQCEGYQGYRILGSVNNITYKAPTPNKSNKPFLQYGYEYDRGRLTSSTSRSSFNLTFPDHPEHIFNYTGSQLPLSLWFPQNGTRLSPIPFNSSVEVGTKKEFSWHAGKQQ